MSAVAGQGKSPLNLAMLSKACERIAAGDTVEVADRAVQMLTADPEYVGRGA